MKRFFPALFAAIIALATWLQAPAATIQLTVMSWNVESGGADAVTIAGQIAAFDGVDLWGLSEVNGDDDALLYETGAEVGEDTLFARVTGTTGGGDRLVALYDDNRFDLLSSGELDEINVGGNVRASLVLTLEETATDLQFIFMVNHLYRTNDEARRTQATLLNQWARNQTLPVIATGDYNFDWDITTEAHDLGYDLMVTSDVWEWIKPATLVTTQCSGDPCAFNSVLDFIFAAGPAKDWPATSEIIVRPNDFPDDTTTSDHRPVKAVLDLPAAPDQETPAVRLFLPGVSNEDGSGATATHTVTATATEVQGGPTSTTTPTSTSTPTPTATSTPTPTATEVQSGPTATHTPTVTPTATDDQTGGPCLCTGNIYNCSDFATQPQAQACMDWCISQGVGDIHRLDGSDNDGRACENLPPGFQVIQ